MCHLKQPTTNKPEPCHNFHKKRKLLKGFILNKDLINGATQTGVMNGYPCFFISIVMIGICTAVIGDVAAQLGCFIYLKDSVNAIAFVALGTSVPGILP